MSQRLNKCGFCNAYLTRGDPELQICVTCGRNYHRLCVRDAWFIDGKLYCCNNSVRQNESGKREANSPLSPGSLAASMKVGDTDIRLKKHPALVSQRSDTCDNSTQLQPSAEELIDFDPLSMTSQCMTTTVLPSPSMASSLSLSTSAHNSNSLCEQLPPTVLASTAVSLSSSSPFMASYVASTISSTLPLTSFTQQDSCIYTQATYVSAGTCATTNCNSGTTGNASFNSNSNRNDLSVLMDSLLARLSHEFEKFRQEQQHANAMQFDTFCRSQQKHVEDRLNDLTILHKRLDAHDTQLITHAAQLDQCISETSLNKETTTDLDNRIQCIEGQLSALTSSPAPPSNNATQVDTAELIVSGIPVAVDIEPRRIATLVLQGLGLVNLDNDILSADFFPRKKGSSSSTTLATRPASMPAPKSPADQEQAAVHNRTATGESDTQPCTDLVSKFHRIVVKFKSQKAKSIGYSNPRVINGVVNLRKNANSPFIPIYNQHDLAKLDSIP